LKNNAPPFIANSESFPDFYGDFSGIGESQRDKKQQKKNFDFFLIDVHDSYQITPLQIYG
jgi:hypothetical protein